MNTRVYLLISPEGHQLPGIVGCGESYINYEGPVSDLAIVTRIFIFYRDNNIRIPQDGPDDLIVPKSKTSSKSPGKTENSDTDRNKSQLL